MPILRHVGCSMEARGLTIGRHVHLVLRETAELVRNGLFTSPHDWGTTWGSVDHDNRGVGKITIAITTGLPGEVFRAVLVHEFAHGYFNGLSKRPRLDDKVEEGFAQALAYVYLEQDLATPRALNYMRVMMANGDPVYGDGLRLMLPELRAQGAAGLAAALSAGWAPSTQNTAVIGRPPRRTRPI